jgi:hypothetical protein
MGHAVNKILLKKVLSYETAAQAYLFSRVTTVNRKVY